MIRNVAAYQFADVDDPHALAAAVRGRATNAALRGTVLVAREGINLFLAGGRASVDAFMAWLREDPRFAAIRAKYSDSDAVPFARLKVKVKREIIAFRRDDFGAMPAPALDPRTLLGWLQQGHDDAGRPLALLDTRNREEVAHGTFAGALTLPIENFVDLPAAVAPHREELRDATVVAFCTGGIRCEKAAPWLRQAGYGERVLQLDGGILGYFEQVGGEGFEGDCFVFDQRIALDAGLRPVARGTLAMDGQGGGA